MSTHEGTTLPCPRSTSRPEMKWAVIASRTGNTDAPGEHSIVFAMCTHWLNSNISRYLVVTLAHLNYSLATTTNATTTNKMHERFRVAGAIASRSQSEDDAPERIYELAVHGETTVRSVWEDACDGAVVGFITKRVAIQPPPVYGLVIDGRAEELSRMERIPQPAEYCLHYDGRKTRVEIPEDASFDQKNPFQIVPWCSQIALGPSEAELQYADEDGVAASGTFIPFGVVTECVHDTNAFSDIRGTLNLVKVNLCIFGETDLHPRDIETLFHERFLPPPGA